MSTLANTIFYLFASPLQLAIGLLLLPFAYNAGRANMTAPYVFLEFRELQDELAYHESFYGPDHEKTNQTRNDIRLFARRCVKDKLWDKDDIRMYLELGYITHLDLKGLHYSA